MRRKNFFKLSILAVLVISIAGGASAYHEYIYTYDDSHTSGCHAGDYANDGESQGAWLDITITPSGDLETLEAFTITVVVQNFTALDNSAYQNRTTIGISKDFGDNADFLRSVSDKSLTRRIEVDANGWANDSHGAITLGAIAPKTAGTYDLVITAVAAMNQSTALGYNFTYAKGTVTLNVVAASTGGSISGGIIGITVGIVVAISTIAMLQMRKRMRKKDI